jgi:hypothetical protein
MQKQQLWRETYHNNERDEPPAAAERPEKEKGKM